MQKPIPTKMPALQDIASRDGVRGAVRRIHEYLTGFLQRDQDFKESIVNEVNPLYGEFVYTPSAIGTGAPQVVTIPVTGALLGYTVDVSYDKDLQLLQMTAYAVNDNVKIILQNVTGGSITLAPGIFRTYVWGRALT
jgi:hypothetical protein